MILVCDTCNARYLIPATAFAQGPRQVRCARCNHVWEATLPSDEPASSVAKPSSSATAEKIEKRAALSPETEATSAVASVSSGADKEALAAEKDESGKKDKTKKKSSFIDDTAKVAEPAVNPLTGEGFTEPPSTMTPVPRGSNLPAVFRESRLWFWVSFVMAMIVGVTFVSLLVWSLLDKERIVHRWPSMENYYNAIGFPVLHPGDGLSLLNINSERRVDEAETQLVVSGNIRNDLNKPVVVPFLVVSAIGADGKEVLHWQIDLPTSPLAAGASMPFESVVRAPEVAVAEINLRFGEGYEHVDKPPAQE